MQKIAIALVKAKQAFGRVLKEKTNPAFKSRYADLGACLEAVEAPCLDNGIFLYQETFEDSTGVTVETVFLHESGESLRCGKLHVPAAKQDPQGYGSALSYCRRYSLLAACGIAAEDDDGNAARRTDPRPASRSDEILQGISQPSPDIPAIVRLVRESVSMELLRANFEKALQMLPKEHHAVITRAKDARKAELTTKEEA